MLQLSRSITHLTKTKPGLLKPVLTSSSCRVTSQARLFYQRLFRQATQKNAEKKRFYVQVVQDPTPSSGPGSKDKIISIWLYICAGVLFCMIVLGALTRLTESGLSIVDWQPVTGAFPPLTQQAWEAEFEKYKQYPEFKKLNFDITLDEFKKIFYVEWAHRNLGRSIGIVFSIPFAYFVGRGLIAPRLRNRLLVFFGMGAIQGAIGWWMVKSGLRDDIEYPRVSPYRLALHLASAFVIYMGILWTAMEFGDPLPAQLKRSVPMATKHLLHLVATLVFLTSISGAFVAGNAGGFMYPEVPYMGESFMPAEYWELEPAYTNFFENGATAQFNHRVMATTTYLSTAAFWLYTRKRIPPEAARSVTHLFMMLNLQVALGLSTLLLHMPIGLAASHQAGAVASLSFVLRVMHVFKRC